LSLPLVLLRGRAAVKCFLAESAAIDFGKLPYRDEVVAFVRSRRNDGQRTFLTTACTTSLANGVAKTLGLFDGIIASDERHNLKGRVKATALIDKFGARGFDYVGDSRADIAVWAAARHGFVDGSLRPANRDGEVIERIPVERRAADRFRAIARALRPHQWVKNLLVFVPLIASHHVSDTAQLQSALLAFAGFCLCASSAYVLNDLLDVEADRAHPRKRLRPFASGDLSLVVGIALCPLLLLCAVAIALALPPMLQATLAAYYVATIAYSTVLKRKVMIDVITLAGLYTARIVGGGYAIAAPVSFWLLGFSMFLFLSIALVKRFTEFIVQERHAKGDVARRGYQIEDKPVVQSLGTASGMVAALVLALYINSDAVSALYRHPSRLWFMCPLLLYWIGRMWIVAGRGKMHDDPLLFAARDRMSYIVAALLGVVVWLAT